MSILRCFLVGLVAVFIFGCGGHSKVSAPAANRGVAKFTIQWPEKPTRLIPLGSASIKVSLAGPTPATQIIPRPPVGTNSSELTFPDLVSGNYTATATAFPNADGTGVAQATGTAPLSIAEEQTTTIGLTMNSTIDSVRINGNDRTALPVGQTRVLSAQALNSAGETVLVAPLQWEWINSNTASFTMTNTGETSNIVAVSTGKTRISLKEMESGKAASISLSNMGKIYFLGSPQGGGYELYTVNPDGSDIVKLTDDGAFKGATISPNKKKIAFYAKTNNGQGPYDVFVMNIDGTGLTNISNSPGEDFSPRFSPDSKKVVFCSNTDTGDNSQLYIADVDGLNRTRLTNNVKNDINPVFSPDGDKIAFTSNRSGVYQVYIMNRDASDQKMLTTTYQESLLVFFNPAGNKILFSRDTYQNGNMQIYSMNLDGSSIDMITKNTRNNQLNDISSDGSIILLDSDVDGDQEIYTVNIDGTNLKKLTDNSNADFYPVFSPDGKTICFTSYRNDLQSIYTMNSDGKNQNKLMVNTLIYELSLGWTMNL